MNRDGTTAAQTQDRKTASGPAREFFVIKDYRSIPASEMRPMFASLPAWLSAVFSHKIGGAGKSPDYLIELKQLLETDQVHKRIEKHFKNYRLKASSLKFVHAFNATLPALGPISLAVMAMTRNDGEIQFFASHNVAQIDGSIQDEGHFGFSTYLSDGTFIETVSGGNLPRPREGVHRTMIAGKDPAFLFKTHRDKIRNQSIRGVKLSELFNHYKAEHQRRVNDLLARGVIRPATSEELTRIRKNIGV